MMTPKSWAAFVTRVILGFVFLMAGLWKVFGLGPVAHAGDLFVAPYAEGFLPEWALWATGTMVPFVELLGGALMLAGWKRLPAAIGLGGVLVLVTFGHLLAEPLYAFNAHVVPRTVLLVVVLALFEDDRLSVDAWLARRSPGTRASPRTSPPTQPPPLQPVNLMAKYDLFTEQWQPRVVAEVNDYQFKIARVEGEFVWHAHDDTDEAFLVLDGTLRLDLPHGSVELGPGELYVVPRGVRHRPVAEGEVKLMLVEPRGVVNTGDAGGERTAEGDRWV